MVERLGGNPRKQAARWSTCSQPICPGAGRKLSISMPAEEQTDDINVKGCVSQVPQV